MLMIRFILLFFASCLLSVGVCAGGDDPQRVLTLSQCIRIALEQSPGLSAAHSDQEEQQANLSSSRKDLLPSLLFEYAYTRQPANARAGVMSLPENFYNYSFTVEQPVFKGRALVSAVEKSRLALLDSEFALEQVSSEIILRVHQAYFGLLRALKLEDESAQVVKRLEKHREDTSNYYHAGLVPKNDLLESEVELAHGKQQLLKARNFRLLSATRLNVLLRFPPAQEVFIEDNFSYDHQPVQWESVMNQAFSSRPELRQAEISIQQGEKDIILARSDYLPEVSVQATYEKQGDSPAADYYPPGTSEIKTASAVAQWKLWSWGQDRDEVTAAKRRLARTRKELKILTDEIILQVREAYLNLEESAENINVTRKAVEQAEENYRLNDEKFVAQVASSTDVLDAQTLLARSRISYYNAIYDYNLSRAALKWASGTLGVGE